MSNTYFVYILASRRNGTLYIGMTNNVAKRVWQHKKGEAEGFTKKHGVSRLMYFETFSDVNAAVHRETQMKRYKREWKINLIQKENMDWKDLSEGWYKIHA